MQSQPIESKGIKPAEFEKIHAEPNAASPILTPEVKRPPAPAVQSAPSSHRSDSEIQRLWEQLYAAIMKDDDKEITKLMTGVNQQEQIRLLKVTDSFGSNLLNLAAQEKNQSFAILFDLFVEDVRNQALSLQNKTKNTALHWAACQLPDDVFCLLVKKADAKTIDQTLPLQNEQGNTILHLTTFNKPGAPFRLLVDKANADAISQALSLQNGTKDTALHFAAMKQPDDEFCVLLRKADVKTIDQILPLQNSQDDTPLHLAACYKLGASFRLLVEKANEKVINQALSLQNGTKDTALHFAAMKQPDDEFCVLLRKADVKTIDQILPLQNSQDDTPLHLAACYKLGASFRLLVEKANEKVINQALSLQNGTKNTALHFAAVRQPDDAFCFLVNKVDVKTIDQVLPLQNSQGSTILHTTAFHKPGAPFRLLVEKANAKEISQALSLQDEAKATALHYASECQPDDVFCFLVNKVDAKAIDQILHLQSKQGSTILHTTACHKPGAPFRLLVEKANAKEISQALSLQDEAKATALHYASECQPDDVFCFLVNKVDAKAIDQILLLQSKLGSTILHTTAAHKPGVPFRLLVEKANAKEISQALSLQDGKKETALHFAALKQPDDVFCCLVKKVDAKAIDQTLLLQNEHGSTALHFAAHYKRGDPFRLLIEKADAKVISQVLALQGKDKETVLHLAAWKQPGDVFRDLIFKADAKAIDQALSLQNEAKETVLHVVACYQPSAAFAHLIKRCSSEALSKACCLYKKGQSVLESALSYQSPSVIAELLNKIDDNALKAMLKAPNIPSRLLAAMAGCLGHEPSFQTQPLVGRLFALAGPQLADYCTKLWLAGKSLPRTVVQAALPHFKKLIQTQPQRASELEEIAGIFSKEEKSERKEEIFSIRLKSGEVLELKDEEKAQEILWQQGLHSLYDYHCLKKHFPGSQLAQTADDLYYLGLLLKGCPLPFIPTEIKPRLAETNAKGEVLFKTIKPKDWPDFVKQMGNYNYRADLRDPKQQKSEAKVKYIHKLGKTVKYEVHKDKKKEPYEQTIKQSVSLLSKNYDTAVFGEHDPNRQLVGLLFSKEFCVIKAMMLKDLGTFYRKWIGSEENVAKYAEEMKDINVTDFETFKKEVERNPQRLNEMLVKLSRKAMLGVVMATDTPEARKQARAYHKDILDKLQIDLPIYFYDRALRIMRLYTPREREDDFKMEQQGELLHAAILAGDAKGMTRRIAGVGEPEKAKLLKYTDSAGGNLFHIAAKESEINFAALRILFSEDVRNQALSLPDNNGCTAIHIAAQFQSSVDFYYLVERVDATVINQVLPLQSKTGDTVLHIAAFNQTDDAFRALIEKTDAKILNQALALQNKEGETVLHIVARNQLGDAFCLLLEKLDEKTLVQVLSLEDAKEGHTALLAAAIAQPRETFVKLIERCSAPSNALSEACRRYNKKGESVLESVLPHRRPDVIAKLLNGIDDDALEKMLHAPNIPAQLFNTVASCLTDEPSFQTEPLLSRLAKLMGPKLADYCTELLLAGTPLPPTVIQAVLPSFKEFIQEEKAESKEVVIIKLRSGEKLSLPKEIKDEEKISKIIWRRGLQSLYDYHLIKRHFLDSLMAKTANVLYSADLITTGCCVPFDSAGIILKQGDAKLSEKPGCNSIHEQDKEIRANFWEKLQEKLSKMPSIKQGFIELLEFYEMFEINKPPVPKKYWYQDIWQLGVSNSEVNQSATVKMIALLQGEYRGINEQEFNALKLGSLGEIMDAMKAKKLLPDEFERQENIYAVKMRKT